MSDRDECIVREIQKKHYLDGITPVDGYDAFIEVLNSHIDGDECCEQGCMGGSDSVFLAACASRTEIEGAKTYSIDQFCIESQTISIVYSLSTGKEACTLTYDVTRSSEYEEDKVPENACCKAAVDDITIAATADTLSELNPWCEERDEI